MKSQEEDNQEEVNSQGELLLSMKEELYTDIVIRKFLSSLCPWCQRGRGISKLPSMPKGEIVGNMVILIGIDVNWCQWMR